MNIVVNEELKAYIDPLTPEEHEALERSLLAEGCRDALVLWGELLVDGHNRYAICQKHGLPFRTQQSQLFLSLEDVHLWMIDQHLGRRSVSDFQRGVLALRKREIVAQRRARMLAASSQAAGQAEGADASDEPPWDDAPSPAAPSEGLAAAPADPEPLKSREDIARAARLRSSQVLMIEKIQKQAAPEVVAALKTGALSLSAAAAVATLPPEEQQAAASGGAVELKQAAKRVREARRQPREAKLVEEGSPAEAPTGDQLRALQARVAELTAENEALRKQVANLLAQLIK
ncbi:plasmid replication/partition related protein [Ramlibacter sp. 2FC]|uniref:plasmid replication/partition related protein n=1 Tax=Ramlibacter sp. 2FC TaxID=2502188 RepID=UPI0010F6E065|nr:plasmid replication/partition related protein [Ramlibacter sp. 2FC]